MSKRVLITGHNGYLGSVMAPFFLKKGYDVRGLDTGYFRECTFVSDELDFPCVYKDIRDLTPADVEGFDVVVHLAALSNDPIGNLRENWTQEINVESSAKLAKLAKAAGVERFLFSSSCIMYGMSEAAVVSEEAPLAPETEYARSKALGEQLVSELAGDGFSPVFLRNGTVYGVSPRMRFDTVLNNLVGYAATTGNVVLHGDGKPWRPVVHVEDIARSFQAVIEAPIAKIHNEAFNNGADSLNHTILDLANTVTRAIPNCRLSFDPQPDADQRTYKADFQKFGQVFPEFEFKWTVQKGVEQLYEALKDINLTYDQFTGQKFTRLKWLNFLLESKRLNSSLRWETA